MELRKHSEFVTTDEKPLKRLRHRPDPVHRAEATVLMRIPDMACEISGHCDH